MSISADIFCKWNETCWNTRGAVSLRTTWHYDTTSCGDYQRDHKMGRDYCL